jgi:elongation factor 2 kinase
VRTVILFFLIYAPHRTRDYSEAVRWYQKALECSATDSCSDDGGDSVFGSEVAPADPDHTILSRMAELYRSGGLGLEKDPQRSGDLYTEAAEAAMNAMKGKLANKFYMLAEEAWAEMPEEEET